MERAQVPRRVSHRLRAHMQEGRAKIADVGMAQMISEDAATHARKAQQQGTFAWAAPEILVKESR